MISSNSSSVLSLQRYYPFFIRNYPIVSFRNSVIFSYCKEPEISHDKFRSINIDISLGIRLFTFAKGNFSRHLFRRPQSSRFQTLHLAPLLTRSVFNHPRLPFSASISPTLPLIVKIDTIDEQKKLGSEFSIDTPRFFIKTTLSESANV